MKTATFWLVFVAALPCAAAGKKIANDLLVKQRNGGRNGQAASFSIVWSDATSNGLSVIWGASVVWADAFAGGEQAPVPGEK
jgi:hypothetical protein